MANKMKRYRAFTIMELAVAMVISGIVVGFCYYAFLFVRRQSARYGEKSRVMNEYYLLSTAMEKDAARADRITDTADGHGVTFMNAGGVVEYLFGDGVVVREGGGPPDTFRIKAAIDSVRYLNDSLRLVGTVFLRAEMEAGEVDFFVNKEYSAQQVMEAEQEQHEQIN